MIMSKYIKFGALYALSLPAVLLLGYGLTSFMFSVAPQENANRVDDTVSAICNNSIQDGNFIPCRIAQDRSNTEFLCSGSNCWVENK